MIIHRTHREVVNASANSEPSIPHVPDNHARYDDFLAKLRSTERVAIANNFPWKWKLEREARLAAQK